MDEKGVRPGRRGAWSEPAGGFAPGKVTAPVDAVLKEGQLAHATHVQDGGSDPRAARGRGKNDLRGGGTVLGFQGDVDVVGGVSAEERGLPSRNRRVAGEAGRSPARRRHHSLDLLYAQVYHSFYLFASPSMRTLVRDWDFACEDGRRGEAEGRRSGIESAESVAARLFQIPEFAVHFQEEFLREALSLFAQGSGNTPGPVHVD